MNAEQFTKGIQEALLSFESDKVKLLLRQALDRGEDPTVIVNEGISAGLTRLGDAFQRNEIFLPELILGGKIGLEAVDTIKPYLEKGKDSGANRGLLLLGTVQGDVHEIGKNIVRLMAMINGFEVVDIGMDVPCQTFVDKVKELKPAILGMSALLSTTLVHQKTVIELLSKEGIRNKVKVIVGGAPVHQAWADKIGADGYGEDAVSAVQLMIRLVKK